MKHTLLCAGLALASFGAAADEVGQVLSSTPVVQQVAVPRQVCGQPIMVEQQTSGGGGLLGAIAGAAIGSQIGGGSGRAAGLMAGAVGGALLGNSIEANSQRQGQPVAHCTTQTAYENRTVAYNVTYEYNGRQHSVQLPYDPGPTIRLQVSPVGANDAVAPAETQAGLPGGPVVVAPPVAHGGVVVQSPAPVVYSSQTVYPAAYPVYPAAMPVYPAPVYRSYPPVQLNLGFGYHHHHRRHRH